MKEELVRSEQPAPAPPDVETLSPEVLARASALIKAADALLVIAGAGMGVDSGLDTIRTANGTYTLENYQDNCQHRLFLEDPAAAWAFHGAVLQRLRGVEPHEGFGHLRELCSRKAAHFVVTSNVDGQFEKAGFDPSLIFNAHGSVHLWQCTTDACGSRHDPWPAGDFVPGTVPRCSHCGAVARPNCSLFDDGQEPFEDSFNGRVVLREFGRFEAWLGRLKRQRRKLCLLELGCGVSEHSLRLVAKGKGRWACGSDEWDLQPFSGSAVRVDPGEGGDDEGQRHFAHIRMGARDALRLLAGELIKSSENGAEEKGPVKRPKRSAKR